MPRTISNIIVNMPHDIEGPVDNRAGTWAQELLRLGAEGDYIRMTDLLTVAKESECLSIIRAAAQEIVRRQSPRKSIKRKTLRNLQAA